MSVVRRPAFLLAAVVLLAAACGGGGDGNDDNDAKAENTESADATDATDERAELRGEEEGAARFTADELIELSVDDLQDFWADVLPDLYGVDYTPIPDDNIREYGFDTTDFEAVSVCLTGVTTYDEIGPNAFFCSDDQTVAIDVDGFVPDIFENTGPYAVADTMAHEWGHVIQDQAEVEPPPPFLELQADCFEGAWTRHLVDDDTELPITDADVEVGLADAVKSRDPVGTSPEEPQAHGSGFDRAAAYQDGFTDGNERCKEYEDDPPGITELEFEDPTEIESEGNLPLDELFEVLLVDLGDFWTGQVDGFDDPDEITGYDADDEDSRPECDSAGVDPDDAEDYEGRAFYCADEDAIFFDEQLFDVVESDIGDFGVAVLVANAYANAVQEQLELEGDDTELALQADCLSGVWTGSLPPFGDRSSGIEGVSPGDLDEAVISFIEFGDPETGDASSSPFERMQAFRTGFFAGAGADPVSTCGDDVAESTDSS